MTAELQTVGSTYDGPTGNSESLKDLSGSRLETLGPKSAEEAEEMAGEITRGNIGGMRNIDAEEKSF